MISFIGLNKSINMKKTLILIFSMFALLLQSCFLDCSYHEKIEFDNINKSIKVLSDNYCIISLSITEYEPMEGYIREIKNNNFKIDFELNETVKNVNLLELLKNSKNDSVLSFLNKKYISYDIVLHEINPEKFSEDMKYIHFVSEEIEKGETIFESEGCK